MPEDAPDVMIVAVDVLRSIIQQAQAGDEEDKPEDGIAWSIQGTSYPDPEAERPYLRLFGDLGITEDGTFIGVTAVVAIAFRGDAGPASPQWTPAGIDEYTRRLAPWASHVLYDTAAACARRLAAQSFTGGPVVPVRTPEPTIVLLESEADAEPAHAD